MNDLHQKLILIYLNTYNDSYEFHEIKKLCNVSTIRLKEVLSILSQKGYLYYDGITLKLIDSGKEYLEEQNLLDVTIDDLYESTVTLEISDDVISMDDIYIPKKFKW